MLAKETLIEKIQTLPVEKLIEVEDFIDFLRQKNTERQLIQSANKLSEKAFGEIWDNPEDAAYDQL